MSVSKWYVSGQRFGVSYGDGFIAERADGKSVNKTGSYDTLSLFGLACMKTDKGKIATYLLSLLNERSFVCLAMSQHKGRIVIRVKENI